jgi:Flp pilus assembly protein TadB
MKDFDSLVGIWNEQKTVPVVDYKEVISKYKDSRSKFSMKFLVETFVMLALFIVIAFVFFKADFQFWTSYLGLIIIEACCVYFIVMQIINMRTIASSNTLFDKPQDHIQFIQKFRKSRYIQHTRNYKFYTIALGAGFSLYFVEFFYRLNIITMLISVTATIAWALVCYFYFMKIYIRKEEKRFEEMLSDLELLNNQFKDEE